MGTLTKHLAALILLAIVGGFAGALAAVGAITGDQALGLFGAALVGVAGLVGVKIGATAAVTPSASTPAPASAAAPIPPAPTVAAAAPVVNATAR